MMQLQRFQSLIAVGETVAVEFKRCGNGISADTFETVCSFLNRFGGDIFLGVEDNGNVLGVPRNAIPGLIKNFIKMISNPEVITPTVYLTPEPFEYKGKHLIHIHVPPSSEVHSYKKVIYDRVDDSDVKVIATGQIAQLFIRKQNIYTEKRIYPYVGDADLRLDLLPHIRQMATNRYFSHPWKSMSDEELIRSAGLYGKDVATGEEGYNLAGIMLLGRDETILSVAPAYRTDAIMRRVNVDRYDDRLLVKTNLLDSYELLMGFVQKHLPDKFYLEEDARISLRNGIAREMLVNTLIHREFTSSYIAKVVIEKERIYTENANRASGGGYITPDNFEPNPKNTIIASFFHNIGLADELGSGVRNLFKLVRRYSGKDPQMIDGDVFRTVVPLDESYSFEKPENEAQNIVQSAKGLKGNICTANCTLTESAILEYVQTNPAATQIEIANAIGRSLRSVKGNMATLQEKGVLKRDGAKKNGKWVVN